jgi:xanthine dehydrogenase accessory factor
MSWSETYRKLKEANEPFVMATLVEVKGSSPREAGARLFVRRGGKTIGTIGGGAMEASVIEEAASLFESGGSRLLEYTFKESGCGGRVKVFLEAVRPERELVIFGGGNVGHALAAVMASTSFAVSVVESRPETLQRFALPEGVALITEEPLEAARDLACSSERTHIVIAGYSHELDEQLMLALAEREFRYLGVLGSATKAKTLRKALERHGADEALLARIHCPAGLPGVGGKGPQEVAISLAAQLLGLP